MKSFKPNNSNAVEIDGISFETLVPNRVLTIPTQNGAKTPVQFGICVTNLSLHSYRFLFFGLLPEIQDKKGKEIYRSYGRNVTKTPQEADFLLARPGESLTFSLDGELFWYENNLRLSGYESYGGVWTFHTLKPGKYKVRFTYENQHTTRQIYRGGNVEGLWTGKASTSWVKFCLAY